MNMLMRNLAALAVAATVSFHAGLSQASVFAAWQDAVADCEHLYDG